MAGAITSVEGSICEGWVCIEGHEDFPATVHLVFGDQILASTIAARRGHRIGDSETMSFGYFTLALGGPALDRPAEASILVGETGETFAIRPGLRKALRPQVERKPFFSYREALGMGLSREDVAEGFYLDILGRPADAIGLGDFFDKHSGCADLDRLRSALVESEEYFRRYKRVSEASGRLFGHQLLLRTSRRAVAFEQTLDLFLASDQNFWIKLVRFFPALILRPAAMAELTDDLHSGLPERELFFRALAALADRPSLLVDPTFLSSGYRVKAATHHEQSVGELSISCQSRFFELGWHAAEANTPGRWMAQIGVVVNPTPDRTVDKIVVTVEGEYGQVGNVLAFSHGDTLKANFVDRGRNKSLVVSSEGGEAFLAEYILLLTEHATCPWHLTSQPDDRQITLSVSSVEFRFSGAIL